MIPFITFTEKDNNNKIRFYILQRAFPNYIGEIILGEPLVDWYSAIPGYNMCICFAGTLGGALIPAVKNVTDEIISTMQTMALWYLANVISLNLNKYNKLKIMPHEVPASV